MLLGVAITDESLVLEAVANVAGRQVVQGLETEDELAAGSLLRRQVAGRSQQGGDYGQQRQDTGYPADAYKSNQGVA